MNKDVNKFLAYSVGGAIVYGTIVLINKLLGGKE
jgi:hypothetical protein